MHRHDPQFETKIILFATLLGFLFGCVCGPFGVNGASWDSTKGIWPTQEMTSRYKCIRTF